MTFNKSSLLWLSNIFSLHHWVSAQAVIARFWILCFGEIVVAHRSLQVVVVMLEPVMGARVLRGRDLQQYHLPPPPITPPQHFPPLLPVPPGTYIVPNLDGFWPWPPHPYSPPPHPGWPRPPPNFPNFPDFPAWNTMSVEAGVSKG